MPVPRLRHSSVQLSPPLRLARLNPRQSQRLSPSEEKRASAPAGDAASLGRAWPPVWPRHRATADDRSKIKVSASGIREKASRSRYLPLLGRLPLSMGFQNHELKKSSASKPDANVTTDRGRPKRHERGLIQAGNRFLNRRNVCAGPSGPAANAFNNNHMLSPKLIAKNSLFGIQSPPQEDFRACQVILDEDRRCPRTRRPGRTARLRRLPVRSVTARQGRNPRPANRSRWPAKAVPLFQGRKELPRPPHGGAKIPKPIG